MASILPTSQAKSDNSTNQNSKNVKKSLSKDEYECDKFQYPIAELELKELWRFRAERAIVSEPAIDTSGNIYLGALDGYLYSLSAKGKLRWKRKLAKAIRSAPKLSKKGLIVGTSDEKVHLLSLKNGQIFWSTSLGPCKKMPGFGMDRIACQVDGALIVDGPMVFIAADALYALKLRNGKSYWKTPIEGHAFGPIAHDKDGHLIVSTMNRGVYAFERRGGKELWRFRFSLHCGASPIIAKSMVYFGCDDGQMRALSIKDGQSVWRFKTRGALRTRPRIDNEGYLYFGSNDYYFRSLSPQGELHYQYRAGGKITTRALLDHEKNVLFAAANGFLYALDARGQLLWKYNVGAKIKASLVVNRNQLYVATDRGDFIVYEMRKK